MLFPLHKIFHLVLSTTFPIVQMMRKTQKYRIILPRSHNYSVAKLGFNSDLFYFKTIDINLYVVLQE